MSVVVTRNHCPCCGYDGLSWPAYSELGPPPWPHLGRPPYAAHLGFPSYEVCSCCGFEYGFDDDPGASAKSSSFEEYRAEWLSSGAEWFIRSAKPEGWDPRKQLSSIGVRAGA
jgi:hypothetical protein